MNRLFQQSYGDALTDPNLLLNPQKMKGIEPEVSEQAASVEPTVTNETTEAQQGEQAITAEHALAVGLCLKEVYGDAEAGRIMEAAQVAAQRLSRDSGIAPAQLKRLEQAAIRAWGYAGLMEFLAELSKDGK